MSGGGGLGRRTRSCYLATAVTSTTDSRKAIVLWLWLVCGLIVSMVVIGGITRLTHSGLSIVEWRPISGAIPPLTEHAWQELFLQYQQYPQYKLLNQGMSLEEFRFIFFWEYLHRLVGRLVGVVYLLPFAWFVLRRRVNARMAWRLGLGLVLGGLQGVAGWYMVKSGLVKNPHVSHYRLAIHLLLAFGVLSYLFWLILDLTRGEPSAKEARALVLLRRWGRVVSALLVVQILYGAFTAGLRAGFGFNTFPKMNSEWVPSNFWQLAPGWVNLFENQAAVQFLHRTMGWLLLFAIAGLAWAARRMTLDRIQRNAVRGLLAMVLIQFGLGVLTILWVVPLSVAVIHQAGACVLLLAAVNLNHALRTVDGLR